MMCLIFSNKGNKSGESIFICYWPLNNDFDNYFFCRRKISFYSKQLVVAHDKSFLSCRPSRSQAFSINRGLPPLPRYLYLSTAGI